MDMPADLVRKGYSADGTRKGVVFKDHYLYRDGGFIGFDVRAIETWKANFVVSVGVYFSDGIVWKARLTDILNHPKAYQHEYGDNGLQWFAPRCIWVEEDPNQTSLF